MIGSFKAYNISSEHVVDHSKIVYNGSNVGSKHAVAICGSSDGPLRHSPSLLVGFSSMRLNQKMIAVQHAS